MGAVHKGASPPAPEPGGPRSCGTREAAAVLVAALVAACSGSGSSPTSSPDTTAPSVPASVVAHAASTAQIDVGWASSSDEVGVAGYRVRREGAAVAVATTTSFSDQGLPPATPHCYTVSAFDVAGNESVPSAPACATTLPAGPPPDTTPPTAPGGLVATPASPTSIALTWGPSSDGVGVTSYRVYLAGAAVGASATAAFSAEDLTPGTAYCYEVTALDAAGNESVPSAPACATTLPDTTRPGRPGAVAAEAISSARIRLTWTAASDDIAVAGYRIWRSDTAVATTTSTTWDDPTCLAQSGYCYSVTAFDRAGNESSKTELACAFTPRRPVPPTGQEAPLVLTSGDETVTDGVTGLVWSKAYFGPSNWYEATGLADLVLNPSAAVDVCRALSLGGETGWRPPVSAELLDIADFGLSPPLDPAHFALAPAPYDAYWTNDDLVSGMARFWFQGVGWLGVAAPSTEYAVRCVLGGPGTGPVVTVGDGTVLDETTGLTWQQGTGGVRTHDLADAAPRYCADLSLGGATDWRLPTVKEAKSLDGGAIGAAFPGTPAEPFWTSTAVASGGWFTVEPVGGEVFYELGGVPAWTRCVRGP